MKLSAYTNHIGVSYRTAWRWFKAGTLPGHQAPSGTILIDDPVKADGQCQSIGKTAIYTRVSAAENKSNLEKQADRLRGYCAAKGYPVACNIKEIGSGVNDSRPKLLHILRDPSISKIVVEHKDRLTRFGFRYMEQLLTMQDRQIEVINQAEDGKEDLVQDFVSIVTSFCARLYGQQRSKRKTQSNPKQKGGKSHAAGRTAHNRSQ